MDVRIDEPGYNHPTSRIDYTRPLATMFFNLVAISDRNDLLAATGNCLRTRVLPISCPDLAENNDIGRLVCLDRGSLRTGNHEANDRERNRCAQIASRTS